jgi:septal ring factor EnvC (AmiA/AmiB activator)
LRMFKWGLSLSVTIVLLLTLPSISSANIFKDLYNLPGDVGALKEQYDATKSQLEEVTKKSQETLEQYQEAQRQMLELQTEMSLAQDLMNVENERLNNQNEQLMNQNEQLSQAVATLQQAEEARANKVKLWWRYAYIGIGAVAAYFLSGRLLRVFLRSRQF